MLSKSEGDKVKFSFINKKGANLSTGLSAGIGGYQKRWGKDNVEYGFITPLMASTYLSLNYDRESNFSFEINLNDVVSFVDNNRLEFDENKLKEHTTLNDNKNISFGISTDIRSEVSFDVNLEFDHKNELSIPRNAIGINVIASLLKLNININKFFNYGDIEQGSEDKKVDLQLFEILLDIYRDLKITPSKTQSNSEIQWYPLATMKNFEFMIQNKINNLLNINIFDSKKSKEIKEFEADKKNLKGIYKRVLKINKLFDKYPATFDINNNISKLDDIYLTMLSNKKFKDKIRENPELKVNDNTFEISNRLSDKEHNLQQFLLDLKRKKRILSSQEKKNMNEKFMSYSTFKYKLNESGKDVYETVSNKFKEIIKNIKESEDLSLENIKDNLDKLFNECESELSKMEYKLDAIDIMSVSEKSDKSKTVPLVLVQLKNKKGVIHHQIKGEIKFNYNESNKQLENISANYYF